MEEITSVDIDVQDNEKPIDEIIFSNNFDETRKVIDTLIISDIHLGSEVSRSGAVLETINFYDFKRLILNGDVFDDLNFKRLDKQDWRLLSLIRKYSNPKRGKEVVWVAGNHDGASDILSHLLGVKVYEEYYWTFAGKKYIAIHGHQFDKFISENVVLTEVASFLYLLFQRLDTKKQCVSRWIKRKSKKWLRLSNKVGYDAIQYAKNKNADVIICGHTHIAGIIELDGVQYYNSGCWTDKPSQYLRISEANGVEICEFY